MDINNISARARQKGATVSEKEKAHLIANNKFALIAFLIQQNAGYFNDILKNQLGYNYLPFAPDHKAIGKIIEELMEKGEMDTVNQILSGFTFKPGTVISQEIKEAFQSAVQSGAMRVKKDKPNRKLDELKAQGLTTF